MGFLLAVSQLQETDYFLLRCVSLAVIKHSDPKEFREGKDLFQPTLSGTSPSLREGRADTQGRNLQQKPQKAACWLAQSHPCLPSFLL